jgi:peptide/nickel transport system substrate-binding protein
MPISGDIIDQAKSAGFGIHESQDAYMYWAVLPGQTAPDKPDYAPQLPWVGDPNNQSSLDRARQVRLALNMAVNKQAIYDAIYRGYGGSTPYSYFYFPFNAGYNTNWVAPGYDVNQAKKILADAGYSQGFTLNLNVANWVADGADLTQAVAQDLAKIGVEVNLSSLSQSTFLPKYVSRNTGDTGWVNAPPPADEPGLLWNRNITSKGALFSIAEGPFDKPVADIIAELDKTKRDQLSAALGQQLYDGYHALMLGLKSSLWAVSKKVGTWPTVPYYLWQTNVENIRP